MSASTEAELVQLARAYYPARHSNAEDDRLPAQRWEAAWDRAMNWKECDTLVEAMQAAFPMHRAGRFIQPRIGACLYCILILEKAGADGSRLRTRIVGAISVLAPLYVVYVTTETPGISARPSLSFVPGDAERPHTSTLARLIEQHLGYRPFPLELADVPLPDIRVDFLHSESPTLLTALFANHLENLP